MKLRFTASSFNRRGRCQSQSRTTLSFIPGGELQAARSCCVIIYEPFIWWCHLIAVHSAIDNAADCDAIITIAFDNTLYDNSNRLRQLKMIRNHTSITQQDNLLQINATMFNSIAHFPCTQCYLITGTQRLSCSVSWRFHPRHSFIQGDCNLSQYEKCVNPRLLQ